MDKIRILIADDHEFFRDGLKHAIEKGDGNFIVVGEASDGAQAVKSTASIKPDIILMDIRMPGVDGIAATKLITQQYPQTRIIALSQFDESDCVLDMIDAGATGYLLKNVGKEELKSAVQTVHSGNVHFTDAVTKHLIRSPYNKIAGVTPVKFTNRELEVFQFICKGKSSKQIAEMLSISKRTVDSHREKLRNKTGTSSPIGLYKYAFSHGIYLE